MQNIYTNREEILLYILLIKTKSTKEVFPILRGDVITTFIWLSNAMLNTLASSTRSQK